MPNEKTLYVVTGPTAAGKTEHALRRAEENDAEIVSCDSLLFYRGMDIGTAKPSREELARVRHHLIDVCDCREQMDITRYIALARAAVGDIAARGKRVLVAGGSGFYLKSFFAPVADDVAVAPELRAEIAAKLAREGLPALVAELRALNPGMEGMEGMEEMEKMEKMEGMEGAQGRGVGQGLGRGRGLGALDVSNPRRVTRALERCRASGRTLAELAADFARRPCAFADWRVELTVLDRPREELERRIARRVDAMLAAGLVGEVERLRAAGFERNPSAAGAIGYRETLAMLDGRLARGELAGEIAKNTRALVKKQRTWFRTQLPK